MSHDKPTKNFHSRDFILLYEPVLAAQSETRLFFGPVVFRLRSHLLRLTWSILHASVGLRMGFRQQIQHGVEVFGWLALGGPKSVSSSSN